uniref:Uncharacterized protein n=1 Tax=Anguilla anguilla TaxID=7936 RepID=A0A0E9Q662_ANGAN
MSPVASSHSSCLGSASSPVATHHPAESH